MSEETTTPSTAIDFAAMAKGGTSDILAVTNQMREAKREETERANREFKYPSEYSPNMGLKFGHVTELRLFFHVIPGHAEALKMELKKMEENEQRNSKSVFEKGRRVCVTTAPG